MLWKWGSKFSVDHVHRMRNMLARELRMPHEVVLITDDPRGVDRDIRVVPLWDDLRSLGKCFVRLKAFCPSMAEIIGPRFAWIDLDCVITDDVTHIFSRTEDFIISGVELRPNPYNGSLLMMNAGCRRQVWEVFDHAAWRRLRVERKLGGTDQAWIAMVLGHDEATWTPSDGVFTYRDFVDRRPGRRSQWAVHRWIDGNPKPTGGAKPSGCRIMVMNGGYDPSDRRLHVVSPWIRDHWK